jgi:hypothetical protein
MLDFMYVCNCSSNKEKYIVGSGFLKNIQRHGVKGGLNKSYKDGKRDVVKGVEGGVKSIRDKTGEIVCPDKRMPLYYGEQHAPCANFCGPGTKINERLKRGDEGVTKADEICKIHDIDYEDIIQKYRLEQITKAEAVKLVRAADDKMLRSVDAMNTTDKNPQLWEYMHKFIGEQIIKGKKVLEDKGIISGNKFVN